MAHIETTEWRKFKKSKVPRHVFAVTDLHGQYSLAEPLLAHLAKLSAEQEKTVLISCGDLIDRGPRSFDTVDLVLRQDEHFDELVLLCGNHEIMVLDALWQNGVPAGLSYSEGYMNDWLRWGGMSVYDDASPDGEMSLRQFAQVITDRLEPYLERVSERIRPQHVEGDLLFIHAGIMPMAGMKACLSLRPQDHVPHVQHWAWTCGMFQEWTGGWETPEQIIVHGHKICLQERAQNAKHAAGFMDSTQKHRRICLDIGGFKFEHLAALEAVGDRYRFHVIFGDQP